MVWAKLDDEINDNPKWMSASLAARGLWASALAYAARNLTDGAVPAAWVSREAGPDAARLAAELVAVGLWEENAANYLIHDFLDYNPSRAEVLEKRKKDSERKRGASTRNPDGIHAESNPIPSLPVPVPVPVPEPTPAALSRSSSESARGRKAARLDPAWEPDPEIAACMEYSAVEAARQLDLFRDHFAANGKTMLDWTAAWRNWLRRARVEFAPRTTGNGRPAPASADTFFELSRQLREQESA